MKSKSYFRYAPLVLRLGLSFVFLWFGLNQIFDPASWLGWLPLWALSLPFSLVGIILLNGSFEVIAGSLLLAGIQTRIIALLLALHLLVIAINLGYNDVAIRDVGLTFATLSIALSGPDEWCWELRKKHG